MSKKDPTVDAYIAKSAEFARPILIHIRRVVHAACPDVEETLKWGFPHFMHHGILCSMAGFKQHCFFGLWKGSLILKNTKTRHGMGHFGKITSLRDLPVEKTLLGHVRKAAELNEQGVKLPVRKKSTTQRSVVVPEILRAALKKNKKAAAAFEGFSPSHRREYAEWIAEAKTEETRLRRLKTTLEWLTAGKPRNWKYMNCGNGRS